MQRIGVDLNEHEISSCVRELLFENIPYVHLSDTSVERLGPEAQINKIREISQSIGRVTLSNDDIMSDVWLLDSSTSPNAKLVSAHTDNPFKSNPEDIVAFWNIRCSSDGGENVITPLERILELGNKSDRLAQIIEDTQRKTFTFGNNHYSWSGPIISNEGHTIRYDAKYLIGRDEDLEHLFEESVGVGDVIKLKPGDVIFFNNKTTVHARLPYSDPNRLNIRTRIIV